ncbi:hypothetical protein R0290_05595 [Burkholderia semiarida]|uniref:hypothetical protein n=1 Tax=Burkholderia TaxID=32008 RepID=UPI00265D87E5|nr:hypothetical protein [Burkholderia sp. AU44665]MDN7697940.1 hypothetical protein [Burkholderia sp. AU44665]
MFPTEYVRPATVSQPVRRHMPISASLHHASTLVQFRFAVFAVISYVGTSTRRRAPMLGAQKEKALISQGFFFSYLEARAGVEPA